MLFETSGELEEEQQNEEHKERERKREKKNKKKRNGNSCSRLILSDLSGNTSVEEERKLVAADRSKVT